MDFEKYLANSINEFDLDEDDDSFAFNDPFYTEPLGDVLSPNDKSVSKRPTARLVSDLEQDLLQLNQNLNQIGIESLELNADGKSFDCSKTVQCLTTLVAKMEQNKQIDELDAKIRRLETEARAFRLEKKSLQSDIQNLQASLTMERDARFREENNNNSTHSKAIAERDLLKKDCLNLKNREEQFRRELKRRDTENDKLRQQLKKLIDGERRAVGSAGGIVGDTRHTPMKQKQNQDSSSSSVLLQRELADSKALNWRLEGEKLQMKQTLEDLENDYSTLQQEFYLKKQ